MVTTNRFLRRGVLLGLTLLLLGCSHEPPLAPIPPLEVVVSKPLSDKIVDWDVYTGTVEAKEFVNVRSRVRGHIKEVLFTEGEEIPADKELFVIDSEPFKADLKSAKGQLTTWEA